MMNNQIRAIVVDRSGPEPLAVRTMPLATPSPGEIAIRVTAISLNRGEVKRAMTVTETGTVPGWDFAGVVENAYGVANAPPTGARVVGLVPSGSWAERVHAPLNAIAIIPPEVSDAQAASLPVAGLTALHALRRGGLVLGRKVLVDGATGGVGHFAIQLAAASGAEVYAQVRKPDQRALVADAGAGAVIVGDTLESARPSGPFDLILDSVGGPSLAAALTMLSRNGLCVTFGASAGEPVSFDSAAFFRASGTSLQSLILGDDIAATEPASGGLALLLKLVAAGRLRPAIGLEADWTDIGAVADKLLTRGFAGKAVLYVR